MRLLGWTDLNETADVTWTGHNLRKTAVSSAERETQGGRRSEQTLAAFWALTRCKTAILAPFDSSVSNTAVHCNATPVVTGGNGLASLMHFTVTASLFAVFTESLSDAQP
eukprot:scaffold239_cov66-Phaeocystis_antarctica.AAC.3